MEREPPRAGREQATERSTVRFRSTYLSGTGDEGCPGNYPAFSPDVVAVGGTSLQNLDSNGDYPGTGKGGEIGWSDSGGGISQYELEPAYQAGVQDTGYRSIPDVSFDADPATGVAVADSFKGTTTNVNGLSWDVGNGTSLGTPCWAGLIAIVNQGRVDASRGVLDSSSPTQTLEALYSLSATNFNHNLGGDNGTTTSGLLDPTSYDEVTGLGSPVANSLVPDLVNYVARTTTVVTSSANSSVFGQSVTFTATVSPITASLLAPTGQVEFFDGTTVLGTETLDNTGTATFTTTALVAGSHAITVQYLGDPNFSGSTSDALSQTVDQAGTTTALVGNPSPSVYGQMVTCTATVSPVAPGGGTPTGQGRVLRWDERAGHGDSG